MAAKSAVVLCFIVALEFVIMISPFAFVFYAALNPILLALNQSVVTRWLTAFFLPHMVVPPNAFLKALRVLAWWRSLAGCWLFSFAPLRSMPASSSAPESLNVDFTCSSGTPNTWLLRLQPGDLRSCGRGF
jgi:hypothetical protein